MTTITIKVPEDVAVQLRRIPGYTTHLRDAARALVAGPMAQSAYDRSADLCGCLQSGGGIARGRGYLKQYAKRRAR
jgi:hypothetical protein